jgi:hypothetical protein
VGPYRARWFVWSHGGYSYYYYLSLATHNSSTWLVLPNDMHFIHPFEPQPVLRLSASRAQTTPSDRSQQ